MSWKADGSASTEKKVRKSNLFFYQHTEIPREDIKIILSGSCRTYFVSLLTPVEFWEPGRVEEEVDY
jgi:hypothetical protein